jgi:hypothetical protein
MSKIREACILSRPNHRSQLAFITDDQERELCEWLRTPNLYVPEIQEMIRKKWGMQVSKNAITKFYQRIVAPILIEQRRHNVALAAKINNDVKRKPGEFNSATLDLWEQMSLRLAVDPAKNYRQIKILGDLILRAHEQHIRSKAIEWKIRKLALLEKKEKEAQATVQDPKLTEKEVADRLRNIFQRTQLTLNGAKNGESEKPSQIPA